MSIQFKILEVLNTIIDTMTLSTVDDRRIWDKKYYHGRI